MSAKPTLRAAIYARYSSDLQQPVSIEDQVQRCREYAEKRGWEVSEEHIYTDEEVSGNVSKARPGYQAMLGAAKQRAVEVVLGDEVSRFSRDPAEALCLERRLRFWGVGLVAIANGIDTVASPKAGKTLIAVNGIAAEAEREMNAERQRRSLAGYVRRGMHAGGAVYGYRSREVKEREGGAPEGTGRTVGRELVIHEEEAEVVRRIFRLYAEGKSARQIANLLNAEGVPPPGARWKNRTTRTARTWSHTAIAGSRRRGLGILNNLKYIGHLTWNRSTWPTDPDTEKQVSRELPREEWVEQEVPSLRIVPQDLWNRVKERQEAQATPNSAVMQKNRARHLLSGMLRCHECGSNYTLVNRYTYRCGGRATRGEAVCGNRLCVPVAAAEEAVLNAARDRLYERGLVERVRQQVTDGLIRRAKDARKQDGRERELRAELARVEGQIENVTGAVRDGAWRGRGGIHLSADLERLLERRERIEADLAARPEQDAARWEAILAAVPQWVKAYVDDLRRLLASRQVETVKWGLARLVKEVVVEPHHDGGEITPRLRLVGSLEGVLRLFADKCELGGSPGGISSRLLPPTQVSFLLPSVRGVRRYQLAAAVKSALRFVRPSHLQRHGVAECFAAR